jgi:hypothetical protein
MAIVRLIHLNDRFIELVLAVALSLALGTLVAEILVLAKRWSPPAILAILIGTSLTGASLQILNILAPRFTTGNNMTSIINYITTNFTSSSPYSAISNGMAVICVALLVVLLVEKVLLDAYEDRATEHKTQAFISSILPLIIVLAIVMFLRVAQILNL